MNLFVPTTQPSCSPGGDNERALLLNGLTACTSSPRATRDSMQLLLVNFKAGYRDSSSFTMDRQLPVPFSLSPNISLRQIRSNRAGLY